jgi:RHS repeat-associated protein
VATAYTYDEYGIPGEVNDGRFQYTGQKWIEAVGLYDYKSRFYAPNHGRFLQTDRIGYSGGLNLYAYVAGDPVNLIDPFGTEEENCLPDCDEIIATGKRNPLYRNELRPTVVGRVGGSPFAVGGGFGVWAALGLGEGSQGESEEESDREAEAVTYCPAPANRGFSLKGHTGFAVVGAASDKLVGLKIGTTVAGTTLGAYHALADLGVVEDAPRLEDFTGDRPAAVINLYSGSSAAFVGYGLAWSGATVAGGVAVVFGGGLTMGYGLDLASGRYISSKIADCICWATGDC